VSIGDALEVRVAVRAECPHGAKRSSKTTLSGGNTDSTIRLKHFMYATVLIGRTFSVMCQ